MGQNSSRDGSSHGRRQPSFQQQSSAQRGTGGGYYAQDPRAGYYGAPGPQQGGGYAAPYPAPAYQPAAAAPAPQAAKPRQLDRRYSRIADDYHSVDQVRVRLLCHW
jgi:E3 ubiquitin-protein ligase RGLG